jgi:glyceraldehyde-3-phosphate dehydrogenase/erythrose-4-phosphate dehydrogenase
MSPSPSTPNTASISPYRQTGTFQLPGRRRRHWRLDTDRRGREISVSCESEPVDLPWGELAIDVVIESSMPPGDGPYR